MIVRRRFLGGVILGFSLAWGAAPARPEIVRWVQVPASVSLRPLPGELALPCGGLGGYRLAVEKDPAATELALRPGVPSADSLADDCEKCVAGREEPPVYPLPGSVAAEEAEGSTPCAGGSCLESPTDDRAWIAVVDWSDPHGWSVAATIRALAPPEIGVWLEALWPEGSSALDPFSPRGVTDLHVLAALCRVEVLAEKGVVPLAINLSFGRWIERSDEPSLAQEIERVIEHLVVARGIPVLAAAGNYRHLQFPAAAGRALPVGVLDLEAARRGLVAGTWETPDLAPNRPRALLPASGLCLPVASGSAWPAPPGSSYATAELTGLLASSLAADSSLKAELHAPQQWWLEGKCSRDLCEVALTNERSARWAEDPVAAKLLGPLFSDSPPACVATGEKATKVAAGPAVPIDPAILSRAEIGPALTRPSPDSNPCVPCLAAGAGRRPPAAWSSRAPEREEPWIVDLSASQPLSGQAQLEAVELRLDAAVSPLDLPADLLAALSRGEIRRLAVSGLPWNDIKGRRQPSLRFILSEEGLSYWVSIPLRILEPKE